MSDFLTNLALKSGNAAEVIQPRTPSLFEPRQNQLSFLSQPGAVADELPDPRESISEREAVPPLRRAAEADEPAGTQFAAGRERMVDTQPPARPAEVRTVLQMESRAQHIGNEVFAAPAHPLAQPPALESPLPANDRMPPRAHVTGLPVDVAPKRSASQTEFAPAPELPRPGSPMPAFPAPTQPRPPHIVQDDVAQIVRSLLARAETRSHGRREDPILSAKPSEPAIQVTIGRIELRAAAPHAAAQKERPASSVMPLEEYLKQRRNSA